MRISAGRLSFRRSASITIINSRSMLSIGVCGTIHRIGTTTQAFNMAAYLSQLGHSVCVVEANEHGHFVKLVDRDGIRLWHV